jgi:hypothetical protein
MEVAIVLRLRRVETSGDVAERTRRKRIQVTRAKGKKRMSFWQCNWLLSMHVVILSSFPLPLLGLQLSNQVRRCAVIRKKKQYSGISIT